MNDIDEYGQGVVTNEERDQPPRFTSLHACESPPSAA
jgi:hypothetical protein